MLPDSELTAGSGFRTRICHTPTKITVSDKFTVLGVELTLDQHANSAVNICNITCKHFITIAGIA